MQLKTLLSHLRAHAPESWAEGYDNVGLLAGDPNMSLTGVLTTLDVTQEVMSEAIRKQCNCIVSHHPALFRPLRRLTGHTRVEKDLIRAIKEDLALYAMHTNIDHRGDLEGVNGYAAALLGLENVSVLRSRSDTWHKLVVFVPNEAMEQVCAALDAVGAGEVGAYSGCSFRVWGKGRFTPKEEARPYIGEKGRAEEVDEWRIEVLYASHTEKKVLQALRQSHPYEEIAYYQQGLKNKHPHVGAGIVGEWKESLGENEFLARVAKCFQTKTFLYTRRKEKKIQRVAFCGGVGSSLIEDAVSAGAHAYITSDVKYHEFMEVDPSLLLCSIGHYEGEAHVKSLLLAIIKKKFPNLRVHASKTCTRPTETYIRE